LTAPAGNRADGRSDNHYDLLVIGGGINGAGIARDAAGRGYSVCLCDSGDFGGGASSASTKLIHGGLRYLEHYEFRLVREALMEREVLWAMAPHIIKPLRFILPHHSGLRPAWLLRLGLFLYDHLGGRKLLPGTKTLDLTSDDTGKPLKRTFRKAFEYSDCWVEDSRLVIVNLRDARNRGADIRPRTAAERASYRDGKWTVTLRDAGAGTVNEVTASIIFNAAGPRVDEVLKTVFGQIGAHHVRLVRGSHIVIRRKFDHERCYIFQNEDERVIFAIPYEGEFTLIGTTDAEHTDMNEKPAITPEEVRYLCETASEYFVDPVTEDDMVWSYSGVRPLFDDGASKAQEATRDYVIRRDQSMGDGSLINVFGGKITTYRRLAEAAMDEVAEIIGARGSSWTEGATLPGGEFAVGGHEHLIDDIRRQSGFIDRATVSRLVRTYGTEARTILGGAASTAEMGVHFGAGLYEREVRYLIDHEWAHEGEDILFRRTKLGLRMTDNETDHLRSWLRQHRKQAA